MQIFYNTTSAKSFIGKLEFFGISGVLLQYIIKFLISLIIWLIITALFSLFTESGLLGALYGISGIVAIIYFVKLIRRVIVFCIQLISKPIITKNQLIELMHYLKTKEVVINGETFNV